MKRRALPIVSVVCLALAGVLLLGYVASISVAYSDRNVDGNGHVYQISVTVQFGVINTNIHKSDWVYGAGQDGLRWGAHSVGRDISRSIRNTFEFERDSTTIGSISGTDDYVIFPIWLAVAVCLAPSLFWWRRSRASRDTPGFPVTPTASEAVG